MTENERLRALLAEAKSWIRVVIPLNPTRAEVAKQSALLTHIDAALAEPVSPMAEVAAKLEAHANGHREGWEAGFAAGRKDAERVRDEARAEVERLKRDLDDAWRRNRRLDDDVSVLCEQAYQRGAEAMREAAASQVFAFYRWSKDSEATRTDIKNLAELIEALPVPEDKP